jgi:hypothetical protein
VRLYSASSEETLRARKLLADWAGEGFLTKAQYQRLEQETVSELRTTNIFLRLVLFLFTLISVGAAAALFFVVFLSRPSEQTGRRFLPDLRCRSATRLPKSPFPKPGSIATVSRKRSPFARLVFSARECRPLFSAAPPLFAEAGRSPVPGSRRRRRLFALDMAPLRALLCISRRDDLRPLSARLLDLVALGAASDRRRVLCNRAVGVAAVRSRHRFDYLEDAYSLVEALLWLGIYLAINLQLSSFNLPAQWWGGSRAASEFARPFYWATWVLIWCLPPIVLARGLRQKDRFVIAVGAIVAILTLVSNKPYLGWQRHTWDPMLLGILLTGSPSSSDAGLPVARAEFATALPPRAYRERTNTG